MEKFKIFHVALYAKGWYKRENKKTLWEDLRVILTLDGYYGECMSENDIVYNLLNHCQRLEIRGFKELTTFVEGIHPSNCWKYGYYTNNYLFIRKGDVLPEYNYNEAVVRYCLSTLVSTDLKTLCGLDKLPMPDYKNGLPRKNGITDKKLKEMFV